MFHIHYIRPVSFEFAIPLLSIGAVTENTERLFALCSQVKLVISTHWIVARGTGHHLAGMGIDNLRANGVGKFPLGLMTLDAYIISIAPCHGKVVAAVGNMAEAAFFHRRVF